MKAHACISAAFALLLVGCPDALPKGDPAPSLDPPAAATPGAPSLTLEAPVAGAKTKEPWIAIKGTVTPGTAAKGKPTVVVISRWPGSEALDWALRLPPDVVQTEFPEYTTTLANHLEGGPYEVHIKKQGIVVVRHSNVTYTVDPKLIAMGKLPNFRKLLEIEATACDREVPEDAPNDGSLHPSAMPVRGIVDPDVSPDHFHELVWAFERNKIHKFVLIQEVEVDPDAPFEIKAPLRHGENVISVFAKGQDTRTDVEVKRLPKPPTPYPGGG